MIIGVLAWPIRYIIFMIGHPAWLVIASLSSWILLCFLFYRFFYLC
jgi:hypothetical protein